MNRSSMKSIAALWAVLALAVVVAGAEAAPAQSSSLLIRNATVHTQSSAQSAVLESTDVLIENGRISAIGRNLAAPAGIEILDAQGQAMTPGIFGGLGRIGLEEIGLEETTGDQAQRLEQMRPEFDVRFAYNPESMSLGVHRSNGVTFSVLAPAAASRGSFVAGLGTVTALDGSLPGEQRALFVDLGGNANSLSGGSRAAQFMLLRQAVVEARAPSLVMVHDERLLTPSGRQVLLEFLRGAGPFVFDVDRAVDIRRVIEFAREEKIRAIVRGGAEAWRVAGELAAANIPVILDPLENLPYTFDGIGATLENAARLRAAGVTIVVSMRSEESQDAGKVRQGAGNAVAHGLAWDDGLAAITRVPAEIFGVADRFGSIVVGRAADLVLWSGDPLDVNSLPQLVFTQGVRQPIASRHTALRDRYFERVQRGEAR